MIFDNPWYLLLLLLLIPAIVWYILKHKKAQASMDISSTEAFDKLPRTYKAHLRHVVFALRMLVVACVIVILARPMTTDSWQKSSTEGVDVVVALDISGSMLSRDFSPNRLEAAKNVAAQFIAGREFDNIGLVIFAGEGFTMCPMTTDHAVLLNLLKDVECGMLNDGTAVGDGLATAVNRIKDGPAKSKTIILLTDGTNNAGVVDPITAAEIARNFGIRIYTIGVGTKGMAPSPVMTPYGQYFRATDENVLKNVFAEIDRMEKTKLSVQQFSRREEAYMPWALAAIFLLAVEIFLRYTLLRNIP